MSTPTIQFITQVKLAELRRQRSLLVEEYDRIARAAAAGTPVGDGGPSSTASPGSRCSASRSTRTWGTLTCS